MKSYAFHRCPACDTPLSVRDSRERRIKDADGNVHTYIVRRLICPSCYVLHIELPDFFEPHKHYARDVVERAAMGNTDGIAADDSTIRRWRK